MPLTNGKDPCLLIETAQTTDTFHRTCVNETLHVRLLSVRCQEAQVEALTNQDYAQVCLQSDGSSLCFCVCDGVGSSYKGDFAAQYLATHLVQWLQTLKHLQVKTAALAGQLHAQLNLWARTAQEQLRQVAIPQSTPALVREVLEELRDTYGSETVFLCGRIDLDTPSTFSSAAAANGSYPVHLLVCWMGNVTAQLLAGRDRESKAGAWREEGEGKPHPPGPLLAPPDQYVTLGGDDDKVARWSTLRGARGPVTIWKRDYSTIDHLLVHTDGFNAIGLSFHDEAWQAQALPLLQLPSNDDMTALELRWLSHNPDQQSNNEQ